MKGKTEVRWILSVVMAFVAMGGLGNAWAECVQNAPGAETVAIVDGTTGCPSIQGQVGCRIDNGSGTCVAKDLLGNTLFTAYSAKDSSGRVNWSVDPSSRYKIDSVLLGGATSGNACGYFYKNDASSGSGMAFAKSNGGYSNVTYADVCTNLKDNTPPPPPKPLPGCPADVQAALDKGTIPGDYAIVGTITDGDSATLCLKSGVTVEPCINEEGKGLGTTPAGKVPRCSEGPNAAGSPSFKRNLTFSMNKTGENSQLFVCLPPTYTFAGGQSCGWVYY
jgi:hypothetical protein